MLNALPRVELSFCCFFRQSFGAAHSSGRSATIGQIKKCGAPTRREVVLSHASSVADNSQPRTTPCLTPKDYGHSQAKNTVAVPTNTYPEAFSYDEATKTVEVGEGEFGPVDPAVWNYEVSGLKVVQSWLGYRMKNRSGKKSSPLDDIRPTAWTFSTEFVKLLSIIEHFVEAEARAGEHLSKVIEGKLVEPSAIPEPTDDQRKAPQRTAKTLSGGATQLPL